MDPDIGKLLLAWLTAANAHFDVLYAKIEELEQRLNNKESRE